MRAGQAFDALLLEYAIDIATRAAVGVGDEYLIVLIFELANHVAQTPGDQRWPVVKPRIDALQMQMAPAIRLLEHRDFTGQSTACDDQHRLTHELQPRVAPSGALPSSAARSVSRQYTSIQIRQTFEDKQVIADDSDDFVVLDDGGMADAETVE